MDLNVSLAGLEFLTGLARIRIREMGTYSLDFQMKIHGNFIEKFNFLQKKNDKVAPWQLVPLGSCFTPSSVKSVLYSFLILLGPYFYFQIF